MSKPNSGDPSVLSATFRADAETMAAYWLPFTPNRAFKADPKVLVSAEGRYYTTSDGRKVFDAIAGIWCSNLGHSHPAVVAAIQEQAAVLDYAASFHFAHPAAFQLATTVAALFSRPAESCVFYQLRIRSHRYLDEDRPGLPSTSG